MTDYNGWENRETWAVGLWIDNDEGLYNYVRDRVQDELENLLENESPVYPGQKLETALCYAVVQWLAQDAEELMGLSGLEGLARDLMTCSLAKVNWHHIVACWISELDLTDAKKVWAA